MATIVFVTFYFGLVSGRQRIELLANPAVATMQLELDGKPVPSPSGGPPWRTVIDFGTTFEPQQLVAIAFDAKGKELGRTAQTINLPRPVAEADIRLQRNVNGVPVSAEVRWQHQGKDQPTRLTLTLDGRPLALSEGRAALPTVDMATLHVLSADVRFLSGWARREVVFGGKVTESARSELSATAVTQTGPLPESLDGCFASNGQPIRAQSFEKGDAFVVMIRDSDTTEAMVLVAPTGNHTLNDNSSLRSTATLDADTRLRLIWPQPDQVMQSDQPTGMQFPNSDDLTPEQGGLLWYLISSHDMAGLDSEKRQFADAAAAGGVRAMSCACRRAVILVIGSVRDYSRYDPATVRRYLARIGVPLFVWSLVGSRPDLKAAWGDVLDVSTHAKLLSATEQVKKNLAAQRIVWLQADPIHALRATVKPGCGLTMVAR